MKKIIAIMFVMLGFMLTSCKASIMLGKGIGELATTPFGIAAGACEGFVEGCNEGVDYLINGDTTTITSYKTTTFSGSASAPVYVIPSQPKEKTSVIVNNSENVNVTVNEVNSTTSTTRTPTVIYVPSTRPSYYYYGGYRYSYYP